MSEQLQASGIVSELGTTKTNKPKIKIGGHWYMLGRDLQGATPQLGMAIDLKYSVFGENGRSLEAWRQAVNAPAQPASQPTTYPSSPQQTTPAASLEGDALRYISNVIGNALAAGAIKSPTQIHAWFEAAKLALAGKPFTPQGVQPAHFAGQPVKQPTYGNRVTPDQDPNNGLETDGDFDSDIPF